MAWDNSRGNNFSQSQDNDSEGWRNDSVDNDATELLVDGWKSSNRRDTSYASL